MGCGGSHGLQVAKVSPTEPGTGDASTSSKKVEDAASVVPVAQGKDASTGVTSGGTAEKADDTDTPASPGAGDVAVGSPVMAARNLQQRKGQNAEAAAQGGSPQAQPAKVGAAGPNSAPEIPAEKLTEVQAKEAARLEAIRKKFDNQKYQQNAAHEKAAEPTSELLAALPPDPRSPQVRSENSDLPEEFVDVIDSEDVTDPTAMLREIEVMMSDMEVAAIGAMMSEPEPKATPRQHYDRPPPVTIHDRPKVEPSKPQQIDDDDEDLMNEIMKEIV